MRRGRCVSAKRPARHRRPPGLRATSTACWRAIVTTRMVGGVTSRRWRCSGSLMAGSLAVCLILVSSCIDSYITAEIAVQNDSDQELAFAVTLEDGSDFVLPARARPGEMVAVLSGSQLSDWAGISEKRCTVGELRALSPDGLIIKRWPPPVCATTTLTVP